MPRPRALRSIERDRCQLEKALSDLESGKMTEFAGMDPVNLKAALEQRLNEVIEEMHRGSRPAADRARDTSL